MNIDFEGEASAHYAIEELTFNPYISSAELSGKFSVDLWIEFSLRCIAASSESHPAPNLVFRFEDEEGRLLAPTVVAAETRQHGPIDLNELLYAEIWYSFVAPDGVNTEFMSSGYKRPLRVCDSSVFRDVALFYKNATPDDLLEEIQDHRVAAIAARVAAAAAALSSYSRDFPPSETWVRETRAVNEGEAATTFRTRSDHVIGSVPLEISDSQLIGRFACRRVPWIADREHKLPGGIGFGGTAKVKYRGKDFLLAPQVFVAPGESKDAVLASGQSVRFWIRVEQASGFMQHLEDPRISLAYEINVAPHLETFNLFLRVPRHFVSLDGGLTRVKRYSVPPRLFSLWESYRPEQCYASNARHDETNTRMQISCDFGDERREFRKLVAIFLITALLSIAVSMVWDSLKSTDSSLVGVPVGELFARSFASAIYLVLSAIAIYAGKKVRPGLLTLGASIPLAALWAQHKLAFAIPEWLVWGAFVCVVAFSVRWPYLSIFLDRLFVGIGNAIRRIQHRFEVMRWLRGEH